MYTVEDVVSVTAIARLSKALKVLEFLLIFDLVGKKLYNNKKLGISPLKIKSF